MPSGGGRGKAFPQERPHVFLCLFVGEILKKECEKMADKMTDYFDVLSFLDTQFPEVDGLETSQRVLLKLWTGCIDTPSFWG